MGDLIDKAEVPSEQYTTKDATHSSVDHSRLQTKNITDAVRLIPNWGRNLTKRVDEVHTGHPLINGQLNLPGEVMEMPYQGAHHNSVSLRRLWTHGVNDQLSEVRVESVSWLGIIWLRSM
jgi:hypothetical protein